MRPMVLLVFLMTAFAAAAHAQPAPVVGEFSSIYDDYKHRRNLPDCPSQAEAAPHLAHVLDLWERQGDRVMERLRAVTEMPGFPKRITIIYFIACGRSISDPVTVAIYKGGPKGPFTLLSDEELLTNVTHELLHNVANTPAYSDPRYFTRVAYPNESEETLNHILVAAFETRIDGYEAVAKRYADSKDYARAVELAMKFGLASREPWPPQGYPGEQ